MVKNVRVIGRNTILHFVYKSKCAQWSYLRHSSLMNSGSDAALMCITVICDGSPDRTKQVRVELESHPSTRQPFIFGQQNNEKSSTHA